MLSNCWDRTKKLGKIEITELNQISVRKEADERYKNVLIDTKISF